MEALGIYETQLMESLCVFQCYILTLVLYNFNYKKYSNFDFFRNSGMSETDSLDTVSHSSKEKKGSVLGRFLGRKKLNS